MSHSSEHTIVIFDGVCTLCNSAVDFLIRHDRTERLVFGSFQSAEGQHVLQKFGLTEPPDTIYVVHDERLYKESDAVMLLSGFLQPWYLRVAGMCGRVVPRGIRDLLYRWVARNRYRWFGKKESCRLPTPEERKRFL